MSLTGDRLEELVLEIGALRSELEKRPRLVWATVTSTSPLRVRIDGDTSSTAVAGIASGAPVVGTRVYCSLQNGRLTVLSAPEPDGHVRGRGTNLIPGADSIGSTGLYPTGKPPGFDAFGYNATYGTVWAQAPASGNGPTIDTDIPFFIEQGVTYRFEVTAHGSVAATRFYVQMVDADSGTSIPGTRGDGVSTTYLVTNAIAGASRTAALSYSVEWTPDISSRAVLKFYTSHTNGTSNPNGYQWFGDIRFVALEYGGRAHLVPTGTISAFGGTAAPEGYLLCDNQLVQISAHPELFNVIGSRYGGNGTNNFRTPDLRGRVPAGLHASWADFNALGTTGGSRTHTLTEAQMPEHSHAAGGSGMRFMTTDRSGVFSAREAPTATSGSARVPAYGSTQTVTSIGGAVSTGGGGAHNNLQPYNTVNYIIKT